MRNLVEKFTDEAIDNLEIRDELKKFLKDHGRKNLLIDRLTKELKVAEKKGGKVKLTKQKIKETVVGFVGLFMQLAKSEADSHSKVYNTSLMTEFAKNFGKKEQVDENDINVKVTSL